MSSPLAPDASNKHTTPHHKKTRKVKRCSGCRSGLKSDALCCNVCGKKTSKGKAKSKLAADFINQIEGIEDKETVISKLTTAGAHTTIHLWGWKSSDYEKIGFSRTTRRLIAAEMKMLKSEARHTGETLTQLAGDILARVIQFFDLQHKTSSFCSLRLVCRRVCQNTKAIRLPISITIPQRVDTTRVCEFLATAAAFHSMVINGQLGDTGFHLLTEYWQSGNHDLTCLQIKNCLMTDDRCEHLSKSLELLPGLAVLILSENRITENGLKILAPAIAKHPTIVSLNLACNRSGDNGVSQICRILEQRKLKTLNLSYNGVTTAGAISLSRALSISNSKLRVLDLSGNCIKHDGCQSIINGVAQSSTLNSLYLTGCGISIGGVQPIQLPAIPSLTHLQLSHNSCSIVSESNCPTDIVDSATRVGQPMWEKIDEEFLLSTNPCANFSY